MGPAPTINIATFDGKPVLLPVVALGTGSGQKGDVAKAVSLWLDKTAGVAIDTAYDCTLITLLTNTRKLTFCGPMFLQSHIHMLGAITVANM